MARLGQPTQPSKIKSIEPAMAVIYDDNDYQEEMADPDDGS